MRVRYDNEGDALYIPLDRRAKVERTERIDDRRLVDLSAEGVVVGIEVLTASRGVKLADLMDRFDLRAHQADFKAIEKHYFQPMQYAPSVDRQRIQ